MPTDKKRFYKTEELFAIGEQRSFTGEALKEVALPLGGLGTGTVSLGGRGQLRDWEIFNRPGKGRTLPYTFPAIYTKTASCKSIARVLESKLQPSFVAGGGMDPAQVCGLPRLESAVFKGEYPFGFIEFQDKKLPVKVELEAFNPFIPLNEKDSAIPAAILRYRVTNKSREKVNVTICWSIMNACGNDGVNQVGVRWEGFGQNVNEFVDQGAWRGIKMTQTKYPEDSIRFGSMALATTHKDVTYIEAWTRTKWWDDCQAFWDDFKADGKFNDNGLHGPSPEGTTYYTTLGLCVTLAPGKSAELPFIITWYFPNRENYWNQEEEVKGAKLRNRYADFFSDAWDVAGYLAKNLPRLEKETREFSDALYDSTLPTVALDAAGANMSIMRTTTCLFLDDGRFYGFEGCHDTGGCCPMNCTHVWNYEQAVAYLFPSLETSMRLTDFTANVLEDGKMAFRTHLPLGKHRWSWFGAADGQMGCILKYWREYLMSGDKDFLKLIYPAAQQALGFVWAEWDKDQDGVMEAIQHNTYDIEFQGANTMMGTLYLGALKVMEKVATILGDKAFAKKCAELFESGSAKHDELLWNGEFFVQDVDLNVEDPPRYQFGPGCLSDQLLGQWFCEVVGLGYVLPEDHVRKALKSIFNYNWQPDLSDHESVQRTYALNDEAGLLLCTWPKGGRPAYPFAYADEVWTGIEYQVAAHLIYENMLEEGLSIVKGVRDRHNGIARNPWDEFECGHHYARAMSSWSLILALTGFRYSAPEKSIAFGPKVNASNFRTFFSTGSGWGVFSQKVSGGKLSASISLSYGKLELASLALDVPSDNACAKVKVTAGGVNSPAVLERVEDRAVIRLAKTTKLKAGTTLAVSIS